MDLCRLYENLIRSIFTFLAETRKRLLLRCRHECYLAPVGFHHYILLVPASHASSAGDMMAVHQTPFNYSWYGHSKDFHLRSLRSTIIFCSVAPCCQMRRFHSIGGSHPMAGMGGLAESNCLGSVARRCPLPNAACCHTDAVAAEG